MQHRTRDDPNNFVCQAETTPHQALDRFPVEGNCRGDVPNSDPHHQISVVRFSQVAPHFRPLRVSTHHQVARHQVARHRAVHSLREHPVHQRSIAVVEIPAAYREWAIVGAALAAVVATPVEDVAVHPGAVHAGRGAAGKLLPTINNQSSGLLDGTGSRSAAASSFCLRRQGWQTRPWRHEPVGPFVTLHRPHAVWLPGSKQFALEFGLFGGKTAANFCGAILDNVT
jgi:hypothetical protein